MSAPNVDDRTPDEQAALDRAIATELDVETVAEVVGVLAVRRAVDEAAYRRVAAQRGVLAL